MGLTNKDIALIEALRSAITDAVDAHDFEEAVRDQIEKFDIDDKIERAVDDLDLDDRIEKWMDAELEGTPSAAELERVEVDLSGLPRRSRLDALRKRVDALTILVASRPTDAIRPEDAPSPLRMRLAQPQPIRLVFVQPALSQFNAWECLDCGRRYHERGIRSDDEGLPAVCAEDCPGIYRTLR